MTKLKAEKPPQIPQVPDITEKKLKQSPVIPEVPKKENKDVITPILDPIIAPKFLKEKSSLESLYWRTSWLQFFILAISFWAVVISSYDPEVADVTGFWSGFDRIKIIAAISGTITSFTNVVLGGVVKQFNKQIDERQAERDKEKEEADKYRRKMEVAEDESKKKDKRILNLETQLLQLSLKMQQIAEKKLNQ